MFAGLTYLPAFVRLRMAGCEAMGLPLMTTHDGSTSVTSGGCDPAVVPVLIDWAEDRIVLDSKGICLDLDRAVPDGSHLVPDHLVDEIEAELVIVDDLPNYQMLIGTPPGEDTRPASRRGPDAGDIARRKVDRCDGYIAQFADDPVLLKAYRAKRGERVDGCRAAVHVQEHGRRLRPDGDGGAGPRRALGRAERTVSFRRSGDAGRHLLGRRASPLRNLGADTFWSDRKAPSVATYLTRLEALPSMRSAILDWPERCIDPAGSRPRRRWPVGGVCIDAAVSSEET